MRIAVTGATGFIGRHVLAELSTRCVEVVAVPRQATNAIMPRPGMTVLPLEMKNVDAGSFDLLGRPDALIHLAWGGLPNYRSIHHFESELPQQYRFLSELVKAGLGCAIITGTCFEYGMQSGALTESMQTLPENPYGFAKDVLRRQLEFLRKTHEFSLTWCRLFYVYGDGQAATSLLPNLRKAVERQEKTFDMSGGEQLRDYLPVTEVVRHLVDLALARADIGVVNVSSGRPISVRRLVEGWIAQNGWDIQLNLGHYPYPDFEPLAFWGDCSKLAQMAPVA